MTLLPDMSGSGARLRQLAELLRELYAVPDTENTALTDLICALDNDELREIIVEIQSLHDERLDRLERLLRHHAAND